MIIIIPVNGLLNRIRSILSAKLISDLLKDTLYVLWIPEKCCNCYYEDIFGNNDLLWNGIHSSNIKTFSQKYNIPNKIPLYFVEKNNICTLRGYNKGEQHFIKEFINSKCMFKIIKAGGNFYNPSISKDVFNKQKMDLYSRIVFSKEIIENIPKITPKTLGLHLRYTDRIKKAPCESLIFNTVKNMINKDSIENIKIVSDDLSRRTQIQNLLKNNFPNINVSTSDIKLITRNNKQGLQYALVDWLTLCHCDSLIFFTGSSFGHESFIWNLNRNVMEIPKRKLLKVK